MRLPRVRFTLGTALIGITASAILSGIVAFQMHLNLHEVTIDLTATDHDVEALTRDLLSDRVIDSALTSPRPLGPRLVAMPRFQRLADPGAELRRSLRHDRSPHSPDGVRLWTTSISYSEASAIVSAVAASCRRLRGAGRVFVGTQQIRSVSRDSYQGFVLFLSASIMYFYVCHRAGKMRAEAYSRADAEPSSVPTSG